MAHRALNRGRRPALAAFAAVANLLAAGPLIGADHLDTPSVVADPRADIGDLFAWMSHDGRRLNLVMTIVGHTFSDELQYIYHVDSGKRFGQTTATTNVVCRIRTSDEADCRVGNVDSSTKKLRVFAGLRDDPFFNNVRGTRDAYQFAAAALKNGAAVDVAGCPSFDAETSRTILDKWRHTNGGPAQDFLKGWTPASLVVSVDLDVVNKGGTMLAVWATTAKDGKHIDRMGRPLTGNAMLGPLASAEISETLKENFNRATPTTSAEFIPEIEKTLGLYDAFDGQCGNQLLADRSAKSPARYRAMASLLADDRLWIDSESTICGQFMSVELAALAGTTSWRCLVVAEHQTMTPSTCTDRCSSLAQRRASTTAWIATSASTRRLSFRSSRHRERRDMKAILMLHAGLLCTLCAPAMAHDFWVQPDQYWSQPGTSIAINLRVGHGAERQRSAIRARRIVRFEAVTPDGTATDLRTELRPGGATDDGRLQFREAGTYVLALETDTRARTMLPAARFNEHVEHEGLTPALEHRERTHQTQAPASERYRRVAKAIVQIGPAGSDTTSHHTPSHHTAANHATSHLPVTKPLGLPLEIVPEQNPYAMPRAETLPIRVIFEGRPLPGALVKLTHLEHDDAPAEAHRTDNAGRTSFRVPQTGTWLLNVIWTKPLPAGAEVDFETTFSSLSFGFPES